MLHQRLFMFVSIFWVVVKLLTAGVAFCHHGVQATAPLVELKTTVKNAFEPFVSDTLMEQISDQLAANGIFGRFGVEICHICPKSGNLLWKLLELCTKNGRKRVFYVEMCVFSAESYLPT